MRDDDPIVPANENAPVRVTVTTFEIPTRTARHMKATATLSPMGARPPGGDAWILVPARKSELPRGVLVRWSPLSPFTGMRGNYRVARAALGVGGYMGVACICLAAGLASMLWRQDALLIGVGGGLIVSGILFVRTGAYREYLAAIEEIHGIPPLGAVLRYNAEDLLQRIRTLWRR